jgi:hypothetical protein
LVRRVLDFVRAQKVAVGLSALAAVAHIGTGLGLTLFIGRSTAECHHDLVSRALNRQQWADILGWLRTL